MDFSKEADNLVRRLKLRQNPDKQMEAQDMLDEMNICTVCGDQKPCGCMPLVQCPNCYEKNCFDPVAGICYLCDYDMNQDPNCQNMTGRVIHWPCWVIDDFDIQIQSDELIPPHMED